MTRNLTIHIALLCVLASSAVSAVETSVSASACAKRLNDGTVVKCKASPDGSKKMDESIQALRLIDKTYPGPEGPVLANLHEVVGVDDSGRITTRDGLILLPAGLKCNTEMAGYLRFIYLNGLRHKIAFVLTGDEVGNAKYAYLWDVEDMPNSKASTEAVQLGPVFGSVNEAGITSHFCIPVQQKNHRYHERYKALAEWK